VDGSLVAFHIVADELTHCSVALLFRADLFVGFLVRFGLALLPFAFAVCLGRLVALVDVALLRLPSPTRGTCDISTFAATAVDGWAWSAAGKTRAHWLPFDPALSSAQLGQAAPG